jgi:hypothetical protein
MHPIFNIASPFHNGGWVVSSSEMLTTLLAALLALGSMDLATTSTSESIDYAAVHRFTDRANQIADNPALDSKLCEELKKQEKFLQAEESADRDNIDAAVEILKTLPSNDRRFPVLRMHERLAARGRIDDAFALVARSTQGEEKCWVLSLAADYHGGHGNIALARRAYQELPIYAVRQQQDGVEEVAKLLLLAGKAEDADQLLAHSGTPAVRKDVAAFQKHLALALHPETISNDPRCEDPIESKRFSTTLLMMGLKWCAMQRFHEAEQLALHLPNSGQHFVLLAELLHCQIRAKHLGEARRILKLCLGNIDPADADQCNARLAQLTHDLGDDDAAMQFLRTANHLEAKDKLIDSCNVGKPQLIAILLSQGRQGDAAKIMSQCESIDLILARQLCAKSDATDAVEIWAADESSDYQRALRWLWAAEDFLGADVYRSDG